MKLWIAILINALLTSVAAAQAPTRANSSSPSALNETVAAAMGAFRQRDFAAAIPPLEKLAAAAPGVAEYQADLGIAYYSVGRPRDAVAPCRKALKSKPALTVARYFLDVSLAESGECDEALPLLEKDYASNRDPQLRRLLGMDGARCGMARGDPTRAIKFFQLLNRDFPDDLDVLYLGTRIYSQLSTVTSQRLLRLAPNSYQAHRLSAEAFETEGQTADAIEEYRKIVAATPQLSGIHYHIGLLLLGRDRDAATLEEARHEFEMELQITPENADAEYELAEMAREARQWDKAIRLFGRAVEFDPKFPDALVGLGKSLVSAGRAPEAVAPLERALKLAPNNAVAHYQLSFAYLRTGRDAEAQRELAIYRQAHEQQQNIGLTIRRGLSDSIARPQTAEPPE